MTNLEIVDILENAYHAGCFEEVAKLIKSGADIVLIEKVIEKAKLRNNLDDLWKDIFGTD